MIIKTACSYIKVELFEFKKVDQFKCIGKIITKNKNVIGKEVDARIKLEISFSIDLLIY